MKVILKTSGKRALCAITALVMALIMAAPLAAHAADNPLSFMVEQVFTTSAASAEATFTYFLKPLQENNPLPAQSTAEGYTFTVGGNNTIAIDLLNCSLPGLYRYEIFQIIGAARPGYTYDRRAYTIEVHVDAALKGIFIVRNHDGTKAMNIRFENRYQADPDGPDPPTEEIPPIQILPSDPKLMKDPPVMKTVFGDPDIDSTFIFKLTPRNAANPLPAGSTGGAMIIRVTGSGRGEFGVWSYDQEGVYYYTVSELNTGEQGYTYDTAVYTITDRVTAENGQLTVSRVVTNALNKQVTSLIFINKYESRLSGPQEDIPPEGTADGSQADGSYTRSSHQLSDDPQNSIFGDGSPGSNLPFGLPRTGDDTNTALYIIMLALGGVSTIGATTYLLKSGKRRKAFRHENT
jgi:pilin isopeptide linkage protein